VGSEAARATCRRLLPPELASSLRRSPTPRRPSVCRETPSSLRPSPALRPCARSLAALELVFCKNPPNAGRSRAKPPPLPCPSAPSVAHTARCPQRSLIGGSIASFIHKPATPHCQFPPSRFPKTGQPLRPVNGTALDDGTPSASATSTIDRYRTRYRVPGY
jgi:hypothetical protein